MSIKTILFDFDETLVSSRPAYYATYKYVCNLYNSYFQKGFVEELFNSIWNREISLKEALRKKLNLGSEQISEVTACFDNYYESYGYTALEVYPNVMDILQHLQAAGIKLGLISVKARRFGQKELSYLNLQSFFQVVIWGDDVTNPKPDTEGCFKAVCELNTNVSETLVCGDSFEDISMGQNAGAATAAALWGNVNVKAILSSKADYNLYCPKDILKILD